MRASSDFPAALMLTPNRVCRYFTWDAALFPNPVKLQEDLAERGRQMVTIVDPHIKRDPNYRIFKEAEKKGFYIKNKDGADFDGCGTLAESLGF